jgi:hypothetical protein
MLRAGIDGSGRWGTAKGIDMPTLYGVYTGRMDSAYSAATRQILRAPIPEGSTHEPGPVPVKGGLINILVSKAVSFVGACILTFMVLVAVIGGAPAASLAGTTAAVGGTSTGIVFASLPAFFRSIKDGQSLVKTPSCASLNECADKKTPPKKEGK